MSKAMFGTANSMSDGGCAPARPEAARPDEAEGADNGISRRAFATICGAALLLPLGPRRALAQDTAEGLDPRLAETTIAFPTDKQPCRTYMVRPRDPGKRPGILIVHDQRGTSSHFRKVARRIALAGFVVMVPDLPSTVGIETENTDEARDALERIPDAKVQDYIRTAIALLRKEPDCSGTVGAVGFVWGGSHVGRLMMEPGLLKSAVLFYAVPPPAEKIGEIRIPLQLHYAGADPKTANLIEPIEKKLMGHAKIYEQYVYENMLSSFANDTQPKRYNRDMAELAFERTMFFLKKHMGS